MHLSRRRCPWRRCARPALETATTSVTSPGASSVTKATTEISVRVAQSTSALNTKSHTDSCYIKMCAYIIRQTREEQSDENVRFSQRLRTGIETHVSIKAQSSAVGRILHKLGSWTNFSILFATYCCKILRDYVKNFHRHGVLLDQ